MKKLLILILAAALSLAPIFGVCAEREPAVWRSGSEDVNKIAITVDDCTRMQHMESILDLCDKCGIKITFFPIGNAIYEEDGDIWRRVVESGHEIGNHTFGHKNISKALPDDQRRRQLVKMENALDTALGYHYETRVFRPPYGNRGSISVWRRFASHGYPDIILWSVDSTNFEACLSSVKNGSILLFHTKQKDVECLEKLVPAIIEMGLEPVTISELLGLEPFVKERSEKERVFN